MRQGAPYTIFGIEQAYRFDVKRFVQNLTRTAGFLVSDLWSAMIRSSSRAWYHTHHGWVPGTTSSSFRLQVMRDGIPLLVSTVHPGTACVAIVLRCSCTIILRLLASFHRDAFFLGCSRIMVRCTGRVR